MDAELESEGRVNWSETKPAGDVDRIWISCAASSDGKKLIAAATNKRLYLSINSGTSWTETRPAGDFDKGWDACAIDADGSNLIAVIWHGAVYTSSDSGANWTERTLKANMSSFYWTSCASDDDGSILVVGEQSATNGGIYVSIDSGANWTQYAPAGNVFATWLAVASDSDGSVLLAAHGVYNGASLYKSTNQGANWTDISPAAAVGLAWYSCVTNSDGSVILAADYGRLGLFGAHPPDYTYPGRLWLSANGGTSWTEQRPAGDVDWFWQALAMNGDGSVLLAGGRLLAGAAISPDNPGRLYSSINSGTSWNEERPGGDAELTWSSATSDSDGSFLMVGVNNGRLYILATTAQSNAVWYMGI